MNMLAFWSEITSPFFKEQSLKIHFIPQGDNLTDTCCTAYFESFDISTHCFRPPVRKIILQRSDWHKIFGFTSEMISLYFKEPSLQTHFIPQGNNLTDTFYTAYYGHFIISTHCFRPPVRKIISQRSDWHDNFGIRSEIASPYFKEPSLQIHPYIKEPTLQTHFILLITVLLTYPHIVLGRL